MKTVETLINYLESEGIDYALAYKTNLGKVKIPVR